ncbi:MAG TPA: hypothetical protein PK883_00735 [Anaerolineaceae bacterium]|nr:hypothetical protein [Anaerolineaceae bacterium]
MEEKNITTAFSLNTQDLSIIDQHNAELANPGRSAALRHIIREWARENGFTGAVTITPAVVSIPEDGQYRDSAAVSVIRDASEKIAVLPAEDTDEE